MKYPRLRAAFKYADRLWFCLLLGSLLINARVVSAIQVRAIGTSLTGIVRDSTGLVLPGAIVELRAPGQPTLARSTVSAADGTFVFQDVSVGVYQLRVTFPEFESFDQTLAIDGNVRRPLVVVLGLSGVRAQV